MSRRLALILLSISVLAGAAAILIESGASDQPARPSTVEAAPYRARSADSRVTASLRVVGQVFDHAGRPLAGCKSSATLWASRVDALAARQGMPHDRPQTCEQLADAAGRFELVFDADEDGVGGTRFIQVALSASGCYTVEGAVPAPAAEGLVDLGRIEVLPAVKVSARVVDPVGSPLAGIPLTVDVEQPRFDRLHRFETLFGTSSAGGTLRFLEEPALPMGSWSIGVSDRYELLGPERLVVSPGGESQDLVVRRRPPMNGARELFVVVLDPEGHRLADAEVEILSREPAHGRNSGRRFHADRYGQVLVNRRFDDPVEGVSLRISGVEGFEDQVTEPIAWGTWEHLIWLAASADADSGASSAQPQQFADVGRGARLIGRLVPSSALTAFQVLPERPPLLHGNFPNFVLRRAGSSDSGHRFSNLERDDVSPTDGSFAFDGVPPGDWELYLEWGRPGDWLNLQYAELTPEPVARFVLREGAETRVEVDETHTRCQAPAVHLRDRSLGRLPMPVSQRFLRKPAQDPQRGADAQARESRAGPQTDRQRDAALENRGQHGDGDAERAPAEDPARDPRPRAPGAARDRGQRQEAECEQQQSGHERFVGNAAVADRVGDQGCADAERTREPGGESEQDGTRADLRRVVAAEQPAVLARGDAEWREQQDADECGGARELVGAGFGQPHQ